MNLSNDFQIYSSSSACTLLKYGNNLVNNGNISKKLNDSDEPYYRVNLDAVLKLKDSTKQLLSLLEEIQTKVHRSNVNPTQAMRFSNTIPSDLKLTIINGENCTDELATETLKELKTHTKKLDAIYIKEEDDDCSVYKRLTRKCHCLNNPDYNDFIIHFNEDSNYTTSNLGEIIKNMRILKKFLFMGGVNTKNSLMFLNEGLVDAHYSEKVEFTLGCAHADICNIFDDDSIVIACISWPCKYQYNGGYVTQNLAAGFLYKLAAIEEGKRYLNYTSKITNDIKKILRKKSSYLEIDIIDSLNATLNLLKPTFNKDLASTYFNKSVYEGVGMRTIKDLMQHRKTMTLDEVFMNLDLLHKYSSFESGKTEMTHNFPALLMLYKIILMEYDNSELNILITNTLNNILSRKYVKTDKPGTSKCWAITDTATEPIKTKNEMCQIPLRKSNIKRNKQKLGLNVSTNHQTSRNKKMELSNGSQRFSDLKSMIIVPIENKQ